MVGLTDYAAQKVVDWRSGKTSMPAVATRNLVLFTAVGIDAGTGFTEVANAGAYARVAVTGSMAASSGSAPSTGASNAAISFTTSTADWTTGGTTPIIAWGLNDSATYGAGNLSEWDYLGNFSWLPTTVSAASPANFTVPAHGFSANDAVVFTTEFGGAAPTLSAGVITGTLRVVSVVDANTVTLASGGTFNSSTVLGGGTTLNASAVGNGMIRKIAPQAVPNNSQFQAASGNLVLVQA